MASVSHRGVLNLAVENTNIHIGKQRLAQTWARSLGGKCLDVSLLIHRRTFTCKLTNYGWSCWKYISAARLPLISSYISMLRKLFFSSLQYTQQLMTQLLGAAPTDRKLQLRTGNPSTKLPRAHLTPWHAGSVEVLFSTKVQLYQIWIYFLQQSTTDSQCFWLHQNI